MPRIARSYSMPCAESLGQMHGEISMDQYGMVQMDHGASFWHEPVSISKLLKRRLRSPYGRVKHE
jgi:hypothetical protein